MGGEGANENEKQNQGVGSKLQSLEDIWGHPEYHQFWTF